jgi:hypothetical protein
MTKQQKRIESDENKSPSLLSWKDDHGGHIAEYIQEVQGKNAVIDIAQVFLNDSESQRLKLKSKEDSEGTKKTDGSTTGPAVENATAGELSAECTPSPQWGFYVPITPPDQEKFVKYEQKKRAEDIIIKSPKA